MFRLLYAFCLLLSVACTSSVGGAGGPLVIREGGVYAGGSYVSTSSRVPCVRIATTEPVVLESCELRGPGLLIDATAGGARLTVRNCRAFAELPTEEMQARGRFLEANNAVSLRVEHNYLEHTTGILVYQWSGDGTPAQTLTVRYNQARNIDGRFRSGSGAKVSFLQLNQVHGVSNVEIAWNQVVNEPDNSLVEDNINLHNSSGTPRSPLRVHNNYVQGAYPIPATAPAFTGTGMTTDGDGASALTTTAYVEAYENQFVSTCNAAMNIAAGHHNYYHHNRLVTSGQLPDGTRLRASYAATSIFNAYKKPETVFFANRMAYNTIGFVKQGYNVPYADRHDLSTGACASCTGTTHLPNPVTLQTEQDEWTRWQQKLQQNNVVVGPLPQAGTPAGAPARH